jgi:CRP-like cAMP-binding protein
MGGHAAPPFLDRLEPTDQQQLLALGRLRRYPAPSILFFEGDEARDVLVVRAGDVKVSITLDDREVLLDVLGAGDLLGELSAIDGGSRSTSATTLTPVQLIAVPFAAFHELLDTRLSIARALLDVLAERLRESTDRVLELGTADALTRVCRRLVEFVDASRQDATDGVVLAVPLTQQEIASLSGLSREAVVKALRTLRDLEWIDVAGRNVTLLDVDALRERALG